MFNDLRIKNRGISGDVSAGILKRVDEVVMRRPSKVFLMIGVNDLARGLSTDSVVRNILLTAAYLKSRSQTIRLVPWLSCRWAFPDVGPPELPLEQMGF